MTTFPFDVNVSPVFCLAHRGVGCCLSITKLLTACGLLWLPSQAASAVQIVIPAASDASLWQHYPQNNTGGQDIVPVGTIVDADSSGRMLLKFNLHEWIPKGAILNSAILHLQVVRQPPGGVSTTFVGHPLQVDWGEGDNTYTSANSPMTSGQAADAGECNWTHRFAGDDTRKWSQPGGQFEVDYYDYEDFTVIFNTIRRYTIVLNPEAMFTLQDWLADPAKNFGWIIKAQNEGINGSARQIATREHEEILYRPTLTVDYSLPVNPPVILGLERTGIDVRVEFEAQAGVMYVPEFRDVADGGSWLALPALGPFPTNGILNFLDPSADVMERYYRVKVSPDP